MLTALLIQARAGVHTNTHANAQRRGTRVRLNSNIFVFPSRTLAGEGEKRKSKRLQARKKKRFSKRKAKDKGRQMDGIKQRRGEKLERFETLYIFIWQLHAHSRTLQNAFSFRVSIESCHKKYIQPQMCVLAYCNRMLSSLSVHHSWGKGVRTSETYSFFQTATQEDLPTLWVVWTIITGY